MKLKSVERYERAFVVLELDTDFFKKDLEADWISRGQLYHLNEAARERVARQLGYDKWSWMGHYDPATKTIEIELQKLIETSVGKPEYGREVILTLNSGEQVVAMAALTSLYPDTDWVFEDTECMDYKPADIKSWRYVEE